MAVSEALNPDLCVIGSGPAGFSLALAAAGLGLSCVLVEVRLPFGRSQAGDLALDMLIAAPAGQPFADLRQRIGRAVATAAPANSAERLRAVGVQVLHGTGRFTGRRTVTVGATVIQARRIVVATGARPTIPKIDGIGLIHVLTQDTVFGLTELPARLAIVGDAPIAFELAQAFRRLGSAVALITASRPADPELWAPVNAALMREGVDLRAGSTVERVEPRGSGAVLTVAGDNPGSVEATHVLVAAGTTPFTESLGLDRAGISMEGQSPLVGRDLRTSNRRVFAIGDVLAAKSPGPAAIPVEVAAVLRAAFFRQPVRYAPHLVPRTMRTSPGLAEIGWSESTARRHHPAAIVLRAPFAENDRAIATGSTDGHVKVVATKSGQVLGVGIVGPQAAELIAPWGLAMAQGLRLGVLASMPSPQPSLQDASRRAALAFVAGRLRRPWVKRVLGALRLLG